MARRRAHRHRGGRGINDAAQSALASGRRRLRWFCWPSLGKAARQNIGARRGLLRPLNENNDGRQGRSGRMTGMADTTGQLPAEAVTGPSARNVTGAVIILLLAFTPQLVELAVSLAGLVATLSGR